MNQNQVNDRVEEAKGKPSEVVSKVPRSGTITLKGRVEKVATNTLASSGDTDEQKPKKQT